MEEPSAATEPDGAERVRLRYEFNVPAPLIPRLMVRTFGLIKNALHWRRGALLRYGPTMAKVWATQDERWVHATPIFSIIHTASIDTGRRAPAATGTVRVAWPPKAGNG